MITIEHLEVLFDAEAARDEAVFARLFARYIATHANAQQRAQSSAGRLAADQSLRPRSDW